MPPISAEKLRAALSEVDQLRVRLQRENEYLLEEIRSETRHRGIIGNSAAAEHLVSQIRLVAPTDATMLITGESGTGKSLVARAIHKSSQRSSRPLIRVNCAAIPRELFERGLFGHSRGAFTGAIRDRTGRFELADGGTLFLDEVGEIPLELQGKLLRVLQEMQIERVGEERTRNIDVRIIAATNRSLKDDVKAGRFHEDLYYRTNVFPIECVPLRDRLDDIPLLAQNALDAVVQLLKIEPVRLRRADFDRLTQYDWPGNVRELENVIERATILTADGRLRLELPSGTRNATVRREAARLDSSAAILTEEDRRARDRRSIAAALEASGGRVFGENAAARILGLRPTTLPSRIKAHGIQKPRH